VLAAQMDLPRAMIVMADADENGAVGAQLGGPVARAGGARPVAAGEGVIGHVYASGMPVVVPDVAQARRVHRPHRRLQRPTTAA
jgi:Nif-specific regulatory protein